MRRMLSDLSFLCQDKKVGPPKYQIPIFRFQTSGDWTFRVSMRKFYHLSESASATAWLESPNPVSEYTIPFFAQIRA